MEKNNRFIQEAEFNVFETEDGKTIKLTDKHYIFKVGLFSTKSSSDTKILLLELDKIKLRHL